HRRRGPAVGRPRRQSSRRTGNPPQEGMKVMDDGFALLEEKVTKAADLVTRLRKENRTLGEEAQKAKGALAEAEKKLTALQKEKAAASESQQASEALKREVDELKRERIEVKNRIGKLVELLEGLD